MGGVAVVDVARRTRDLRALTAVCDADGLRPLLRAGSTNRIRAPACVDSASGVRVMGRSHTSIPISFSGIATTSGRPAATTFPVRGPCGYATAFLNLRSVFDNATISNTPSLMSPTHSAPPGPNCPVAEHASGSAACNYRSRVNSSGFDCVFSVICCDFPCLAPMGGS